MNFWKERYSEPMASWLVIVFAVLTMSVLTDAFGFTKFSQLGSGGTRFREAGILKGGLPGALMPLVFFPFVYYKIFGLLKRGKIIRSLLLLGPVLVGFMSTFLLASWAATFAYLLVSALSVIFIIIRIKSEAKYFFLFMLVLLLLVACPFIKKAFLSYEDITRVVDKFNALATIRIKAGEVEAADGSVGERLGLLKIAVEHFLQHPFVGIGRGSFLSINKRKVHNNFVQMFAETGLVGGVSFILLMITILVYLVNGLKASSDKAFWFFLLNSYLVTVITLTLECYVQLKFFWVFIVPFALYAGNRSIKRKTFLQVT